jgi:hypothetical protein
MKRNIRKIEIDRDFLVNEYIINKSTPDQIAQSCGCSSSTVRLRIKEFKILVRGRKESAKKADISELELKELYLNKKLSTREIAKVTGLGKSTIFSYIVKYNIQLRSKSEGNTGKVRSAETRNKISLNQMGEKNKNYGKHFSESHKKKLSESNKGKKLSEETKRKISEKHKGTLMSEETKRKISISHQGEKSYLWRGGHSFEPYCEKFNRQLKESVRIRFNRVCARCGSDETRNGERLSCHHINFDKKSGCFGKRWNLIPLCKRCHTWTSCRRGESFSLLINWWVIQPNINLESFPFCNLTLNVEYRGLNEVL